MKSGLVSECHSYFKAKLYLTRPGQMGVYNCFWKWNFKMNIYFYILLLTSLLLLSLSFCWHIQVFKLKYFCSYVILFVLYISHTFILYTLPTACLSFSGTHSNQVSSIVKHFSLWVPQTSTLLIQNWTSNVYFFLGLSAALVHVDHVLLKVSLYLVVCLHSYLPPLSPLLISLMINVIGPQRSLSVPPIYSFMEFKWQARPLSLDPSPATQWLHAFSNRLIKCNRFQV